MIFAIKIATSATVIAFASWLAGRRPELAGFIIALPIASLLALAFSHIEHGNSATSIAFAKSILLAVPVSYVFFVPFFLADRLSLGIWQCYVSGLLLLGVGYFIHRALVSLV